EHFQLERQGYFVVDPDSKPGALVLGRTVSLKDTWAKTKTPEPRPARSKPAPAPSPTPSPQQLDPSLRELLQAAIAAGAPEKEATALIANDLVGELRARKIETP